MSIKTFKRILAVTMAASMLAMPLTVGATDSADSTRSDSSVISSTERTSRYF